MSNKINGIESRPVSVGSGAAVPKTRDATSDAPAAHAAPATSGVQITDGARQLAALERAIANVPVVNSGKVQQISRAIEEGRYQVRPDQVADKLLRLDQMVFGARSATK